jgi:hypothetical protein
MPDMNHVELATEVMQMIMAGKSKETIRAKALEAKKAMTESYLEMFRSLNLVDQLVSVYAIDPLWTWGWLFPQAAPSPNIGKSTRPERVVAIAKALLSQGAKTVTAKDIAEQLQREGESATIQNLTISAGNILYRTTGWKRVKPGEYAPTQEEAA